MRTSRTTPVRVAAALAAATTLAVGGAAGAAAATSTSSVPTESSVPGVPAGSPAVGTAAGSAAVGTAAGSAAAGDVQTATLRQLADKAGIKIGAAINMDVLPTDAAYRAAAQTEFSSVTPENVMKWEVIEPRRGEFNWTQADQLVAFAKANGQVVRGHTLVWHSQLPAWVTEGNFSATELRTIMRDHIFAVLTHFKGQISQWDVVNEALNEDGTLRDSVWLRTLGPSYIADAFRFAHQADPSAKLFYNDYNVEGINAKSDAAYSMAQKLKSQGVPVQGLGMQAHFDIQYGYPDVLSNMQRFARLGAEIAVTEADVRFDLPADNIKLAAQAAAYDVLMDSCLLVSSCRSFTIWGISDRYSWIPGVFEGQGAALPWDENYNRKPAYETLRRDLAVAAGQRG